MFEAIQPLKYLILKDFEYIYKVIISINTIKKISFITEISFLIRSFKETKIELK